MFETNFAITDNLLDNSGEGKAARQRLGDVFTQKVSRLYEAMGIEIGYRYRDSPVVGAEPEDGQDDQLDQSSEGTLYRPSLRSGARLPSAFRADGSAVFDQLDACGFTLLCASDEDSLRAAQPLLAAAAEVGLPLTILPLHEPALRALYQCGFVLVRPDQHICWSGHHLPADMPALINRIRGAK